MNIPMPAIRTDTRPRFQWPVLGRKEWGFGPIAWFSDYYAAVDFVNANIGKRTLFIGDPEEGL